MGHLALFDERLIDALHVVESLTRSPEALANLLEAAGPLAWSTPGSSWTPASPENRPSSGAVREGGRPAP